MGRHRSPWGERPSANIQQFRTPRTGAKSPPTGEGVGYRGRVTNEEPPNVRPCASHRGQSGHLHRRRADLSRRGACRPPRLVRRSGSYSPGRPSSRVAHPPIRTARGLSNRRELCRSTGHNRTTAACPPSCPAIVRYLHVLSPARFRDTLEWPHGRSLHSLLSSKLSVVPGWTFYPVVPTPDY